MTNPIPLKSRVAHLATQQHMQNPLICVSRLAALVLNIMLMVIGVGGLVVEVGCVSGVVPWCQIGCGACKTPVCGYVLYLILAGTGFINCLELRRKRYGRKPNVRFYLYNCLSFVLGLAIPLASVHVFFQPEAGQSERVLGAVILNWVVPFLFICTPTSLALLVRRKMTTSRR